MIFREIKFLGFIVTFGKNQASKTQVYLIHKIMPLKKYQASKFPVIVLIKCKRKHIYCKLTHCHGRGKGNKLHNMYRKA